MSSAIPDQVRLVYCDHAIDLWLADYQEIRCPQLHAKLRLLLSDGEREWEARLPAAADRLRYLVTRALVRSVLSRYVKVDPAEWEFVSNAYGRPELAAHHNLPTLCFNITHTRSLIALAVSTRRAMGVDVECVFARTGWEGIVSQFFSQSEVAELAGLPHELRMNRFFEYWTLKESYIKARGMGLSLPLNRFSLHFPDAHAVHIAFDNGFDDSEPMRWCFWQCRPASQYLLALCAERIDNLAPTITVRKVVPLIGDSMVDTKWLRMTF